MPDLPEEDQNLVRSVHGFEIDGATRTVDIRALGLPGDDFSWAVGQGTKPFPLGRRESAR